MSEVQVAYSGVLSWVPQPGGESKVSVADALTVISLFAADIWTAGQCKNKFVSLLGRELTQPEIDDLLSIANYVRQGGTDEKKMARLQRVRNGLEAIERNLGLTELEIRQLAGI